jgi:SNF2 family DNA or RNA helicase
VWPLEVNKWNLPYSVGILHGTKKAEVLEENHDIYVINPEGLDWLVKYKKPAALKQWIAGVNTWLVVDESSMFRNGRSVRFKNLKKILKHFRYRTILTGTPAPNGLEGLWGQLYLLDSGVRLGEYITNYRNTYFYPSGFGGYTYLPQEGAEEKIYERIGDIIISQDRSVLDMPPLTPVPRLVQLDNKAMRIYKDMEKEFISDLEDKGLVAASTGAVASMKCRQISAGAVYNDKKQYTVVHKEKVEALKELIEEMEGQPLMLFYEFNFELELIEEAIGKVVAVNGSTKDSELIEIERDWNEGKIDKLALHPKAGGHGLNLQDSGCTDICWITPTWDAELWEQAYSRVWRQGVAGGVRMHIIVAEGTIDVIVLRALSMKESVQQSLKNALAP